MFEWNFEKFCKKTIQIFLNKDRVHNLSFISLTEISLFLDYSLQRRIQNTAKLLRWSVLQK